MYFISQDFYNMECYKNGDCSDEWRQFKDKFGPLVGRAGQKTERQQVLIFYKLNKVEFLKAK